MITLPDIPALYVGRISKEYRWVVRKRKKDATYQVAVSGAKGAIRILLYVLLICVLNFCWKNGIQFRVSDLLSGTGGSYTGRWAGCNCDCS